MAAPIHADTPAAAKPVPTGSATPYTTPVDVNDALSEASRSSLGYEPTDVRLLCLGQSLVTALTSADLRREVVPGLLHLSRLSLSRRVRFTNRFTEPVLDLRLSALPRARPRALRPVGSSAHRRPPAPRAGQNRRFYSP